MDRSVRAGISGALLAMVIELFLPVDLGFFDFLPSFFAAILIIFIFRFEALKDALIASFMTYIFDQGVVNTIGLAIFYVENVANEQYVFTVDILLVFSPIVTSISALIAGYIGVRLVKKMKPAHELLQQPSLPPPLPPV